MYCAIADEPRGQGRDRDSGALIKRIKADQVDAQACQWRLDHIADYEKSRSWMESAANLVIDATSLPATDVAERIAKRWRSASPRPASPVSTRAAES